MGACREGYRSPHFSAHSCLYPAHPSHAEKSDDGPPHCFASERPGGPGSPTADNRGPDGLPPWSPDPRRSLKGLRRDPYIYSIDRSCSCNPPLRRQERTDSRDRIRTLSGPEPPSVHRCAPDLSVSCIQGQRNPWYSHTRYAPRPQTPPVVLPEYPDSHRKRIHISLRRHFRIRPQGNWRSVQ